MTTWYVSGTGNDTTGDGLSDATAYRLPSKALSVASAGDTINVARGYTYAGTCAVSLANITIQAYGSGARPIFTNAAGHGCVLTGAGITLTSLDFYNSNGSNLYGDTGGTGTVWDCLFRSAVGASSDGATLVNNASFTFYDCTASSNGDDGFSASNTAMMVCYRCISTGHTATGASDGFTNHNNSVVRMWFCESYGNTKGVSLTSDNGGGASWCVGCYIHDNTAEQYVTTNSGGSAAAVNPDFVVGCLIVDPNNAAASKSMCGCGNSSKFYVWNNTFYNGNASGVNNLYSVGATQTAGQSTYQSSIGNNLFCLASGVGSLAFHVRVSTDVTGNVEHVLDMKYNYYDDVGGVSRFFNGAARSWTTWKTYPNSAGNAFDNVPAGSSYFTAFTSGETFASKGAARDALATGVLRMKGTSLPSAITALGLNYDLSGHVIQGSTPDIGCIQFASANRSGRNCGCGIDE